MIPYPKFLTATKEISRAYDEACMLCMGQKWPDPDAFDVEYQFLIDLRSSILGRVCNY